MEELKKLYEEQFKAIKSGNYPRLNEINKQIFAIREEKRKADKKARQQERENKLNERIEQILT